MRHEIDEVTVRAVEGPCPATSKSSKTEAVSIRLHRLGAGASMVFESFGKVDVKWTPDDPRCKQKQQFMYHHFL